VITASLLSVFFLLALGRNRDPVMSSMRAGFHGGMFGFFLAMPLIGSSVADLSLSESTADTIGWSADGGGVHGVEGVIQPAARFLAMSARTLGTRFRGTLIMVSVLAENAASSSATASLSVCCS